jgi:Zn-dependent protease/CBS domain-containing protein
VFGRSIQLTHVFGIRIGLDPSWFLALFLFIWWMTGYYQDAIPGSEDSGSFLLATISAFLFFLSILLHELGHAVVAIRRNIEIAGIDLWLFGGIAKMARDTERPRDEFEIAVAGPLVTLLIAAACAGAGILASGADDYWSAMIGEPQDLSDSLLAVLALLTSVNVIVLLFNLIPAFPLDGGRIARAVAWWLTGDRGRATTLAARVGQGFSWALILFGIFIAIYTGELLSGAWLVFVGWFLGGAARRTVYQTAVLSKIEGVRVSDVMDAEPVAISADIPVARALEEYFLRYRWPWFPVVDERSRFIGLVERERAERVPDERQALFTVREIMSPEEKAFRVHTDDPLEALLGSEPLQRAGALIAVDRDGRLRGVVTLDHLRRALRHGVPARSS